MPADRFVLIIPGLADHAAVASRGVNLACLKDPITAEAAEQIAVIIEKLIGDNAQSSARPAPQTTGWVVSLYSGSAYRGPLHGVY